MTESKIKELVTKGCLELHHTACKKGYVGVNDTYIYPYDGRFGLGYAIERPTKLGFDGRTNKRHYSNSYHQIEYYIKTK